MRVMSGHFMPFHVMSCDDSVHHPINAPSSHQRTILERGHLAPRVDSQIGGLLMLSLSHVQQNRCVIELQFCQDPFGNLPPVYNVW